MNRLYIMRRSLDLGSDRGRSREEAQAWRTVLARHTKISRGWVDERGSTSGGAFLVFTETPVSDDEP